MNLYSPAQNANAARRSQLAVVLCCVMVVLASALLQKVVPGAAGVTLNRVFAVLTLAVGGAYILAKGAATGQVLRSPIILLILFLPFVSILWSGSKVETLKDAVALSGLAMLAVLMGSFLSLRQVCLVVALATGLQSLLGLMLIFGVPKLGLAISGPLTGSWIGLFSHKNGLGQSGGTGMIYAIFALAAGRWNPQISAALLLSLLVNMAVLAGSSSVTSYVVVLAALLVGAVLLVFPRAAKVLLTFFVIGLLVGPLLVYVFIKSGLAADALSAMGKRQDLSSRLPIWLLTLEFINQRPLLGWGPGWFWKDNLFAQSVFMNRLHFVPFYSHNGVLETWLSYGMVGLVAIFVLLADFLRKLVKVTLARISDPSVGIFLVQFTYIVFQNMTESTFFLSTSTPWLMLLTMYAMLLRASREALPETRQRSAMRLR